MKYGDEAGKRTLEVAEDVNSLLASHGIEAAVIGAIAAAAHKHVRETRDFDLATHTLPFPNLAQVERELRERGYDAELVTPDADDPLGGVINVRGDDFELVQVVNFLNPYGTYGALGEEAVRTAVAGMVPGSKLRVVDLAHLVALKLRGGGPKNKIDVIELLTVNAPLDLAPIRDVCSRHGLAGELEKILADLGDLERP